MQRSKKIDIMILSMVMLSLLALDLASKQIATVFLHGTHSFFQGNGWQTGLQFAVNKNGFHMHPIYFFILTTAISWVMWKLRPVLAHDWLAIAIAAIITCAGVWGNCLDFLMRDGVVDFFMVHIDNGVFSIKSIFNFADIYIVLGVSMVGSLNIIRWVRLIEVRYNLRAA